MKRGDGPERADFRSVPPLARKFGCASSTCAVRRAHSSTDLHQSPPCHPQIRQREHGDELRRVLRQPAVAELGEPELTLEHAEGVLDLGANAGLHPLHALGDKLGLDEWIELPALA